MARFLSRNSSPKLESPEYQREVQSVQEDGRAAANHKLTSSSDTRMEPSAASPASRSDSLTGGQIPMQTLGVHLGSLPGNCE